MRHVRFGLIPLLVVPLGWVLFQGLGRDPREIPSPLIGRPAPDVVLQSMDGDQVSLAAYRGRPVLVNFWASWCFECIAEHQVLMDAQRRYGADFAIVGILYQDTVEDARSFLALHGDGGWPNLVDAFGRAAIEFGVSGVPESFFIDADGIVRYKRWGAVTYEVIETQLPPLLEPSTYSSPGAEAP
jgi:cytochrome c biogenesis protein CcmG/thiol:disulfide interchange protein DsbE